MRYKFSTLTLVLLLFIAGRTEAGILQDFSVNHCAWMATHIVVIDEAGSVLESLKGNLPPGFRVPLDQLKMPTQKEIDQALQSRYAAKVKPSSKRRILFLIKENEKWKPASIEMKISMAWQEEDAIFGFQQIMNPGPLLLVKLEDTNQHFYQIIKDTVTLQAKLNATRQITDPEKRAQALAEFILYPFHCRREALVELGKCGDAAEKVILQLLDDETKAQNTFHADLILLYGHKFRERARPWLMRQVIDGLAYWKKLAPDLKPDWWTTQSARQHSAYIKLYYSLSVLGTIGITEKDREPIQQLIDFWKSQPALDSIGKGYNNEGPVGESQIVEAAQRCLKKK